MKGISSRLSYLSILVLALLVSTHEAAAQALPGVDSMAMMPVPPYPVPDIYLSPTPPPLPPVLDNSQHPWFRPIYNQAALECGQASGIAYNFTYEMDRQRNLPANVPGNQYPTHFAWNFSNNGSSVGIGYFESWSILRHHGTPNVTEWGGTCFYGGPARWISGYDTYRSAMDNRIDGIYQIKVNDTTGIRILKHWLTDHLNGDSTGGVASFYAQYTSSPIPLPAGTPEGGKHVITYWGSSPNHAMCIVGYNDSICWDYNNDGQYTNDIDITGDGFVTLADWEIGGFKLANSYGGVPAWGDNGFCYFMYRTLASPLGAGGIWNQAVHVIDVVDDYEPLLTLKVKVKHSNRAKLNITAGISNASSSFSADHVIDLPAFRYKGGNHYMQGGTNETDKTIEIGLDITPLLSYIDSSSAATFFLVVDERDPGNSSSGEIISVSLMDYSGSQVQEITYPFNNIPILNNMRTEIPIAHTLSFSKPQILDTALPALVTGQVYSHQMSSAFGSGDHTWDIEYPYDIVDSTVAFPSQAGTSISLWGNTNKKPVALGFNFPFFGKEYDSVWVHVDGYITFDDQLYPWPYVTDEASFLKGTVCIAPMMNKSFNNYASDNDGVWAEVQADGILFRWKSSLDGSASSSDVHFAVKLCHDGSLYFYYGNQSFPWVQYINAGISAGNGRDFVHLPVNGSSQAASGTCNILRPLHSWFPAQINSDGILSISGSSLPDNATLRIRVTDDLKIYSSRDFTLSMRGVDADVQLADTGSGSILTGDTVGLTLILRNIGEITLSGAIARIDAVPGVATVLNPQWPLPDLYPDSVHTFPGMATLVIDSFLTDHTPLDIKLSIIHGSDTFSHTFTFEIRAASLQAGQVRIADGQNNSLDAGETAALIVGIRNTGGPEVTGLQGRLFTWNPYIQIVSDSILIPAIPSDTFINAFFLISASAQLPAGQLVLFRLELEADGKFVDTLHFFIIAGDQVETFETGDFSLFPWNHSGTLPWYADTNEVHGGDWSSHSGDITHNEVSELYISVDVLNEDEIRFWRKVSCEPDANNHNYDYLAFFIDGVEQVRWDGDLDWQEFSYPVSKGLHSFKWQYRKDYSVSTGDDCAWLDDIRLPAHGTAPPLAIDDPELAIDFLVYPNPAETNVFLDLGNWGDETVTITFFDITGRTISRKVDVGLGQGGVRLIELEIPAEYASTIVFIRVESGSAVQVRKLIVR